MRNPFNTRELAETFCERCGQVCGDGCRRPAVRERVLLQQLWLGVRL
jgi:hypothetical protein